MIDFSGSRFPYGEDKIESCGIPEIGAMICLFMDVYAVLVMNEINTDVINNIGVKMPAGTRANFVRMHEFVFLPSETISGSVIADFGQPYGERMIGTDVFYVEKLP